ncbi:hypothetical protein [Janthinobacterium sp. HLX7-2]|uniref:hypothetical protein n=1 Tax=Janthinobacterium sp. HLX7-2 TaxID=1259331 RepID=UPI003F271D9C
MHLKIIMLAGSLALLAGCAGAPGKGEVVATWYNPPSEFPGICMTQLKNGALRFDGGFTFFNPARWSYDATASELTLLLPPSSSPLLASAHADKSLHAGLLRVDSGRHALVYGVKADTKTLGLGGFVFYRDMPCVLPVRDRRDKGKPDVALATTG